MICLIESWHGLVHRICRSQNGDAWRIPVNTVIELVTCNKHYLANVFENVVLFKGDILFSSLL